VATMHAAATATMSGGLLLCLWFYHRTGWQDPLLSASVTAPCCSSQLSSTLFCRIWNSSLL
jgi:hypothetical protein